MTVVWADSFYYKHVVVVGQVMSFVEMVRQGITIYKDRLNGTGNNAKVTGGVARGMTAYGNTLIITNTGGLEVMTAWVQAHGVHGAKAGTNNVPVSTGAIIQAKDIYAGARLGSCGGSVRVGIKITGDVKEIYHLEDYTMSSGGTYTGEEVDERDGLLRVALGTPTVAPTSPAQNLDDLIRIIDGFSTGH